VCEAGGTGAHLHSFIEWVHAVLLACSVAAWSTHLRRREQMRDIRERVRNGGSQEGQGRDAVLVAHNLRVLLRIDPWMVRSA